VASQVRWGRSVDLGLYGEQRGQVKRRTGSTQGAEKLERETRLGKYLLVDYKTKNKRI